MAEHWVLIRELDAAVSLDIVGQRVGGDEVLTVGREGQLQVGVALPDLGISRHAVTVSATREGWLIKVTNRNGAVIHPWGLASYRAHPNQLLHWPLIGIRIAGADGRGQHWVLLDSDAYQIGADQTGTQGQPAFTQRGAPPPPLAPAELSAIEIMFEEYLAWPPPPAAPVPRQLKQVASRLGKSLSGVQDRLHSAQEKALRLGLPRPTTLSQPDYFHVLVAAGYIQPSARRPYRDHPTHDAPNAPGGPPRPGGPATWQG